jgi:tetratricopeptide (TPR) repeat protein
MDFKYQDLLLNFKKIASGLEGLLCHSDGGLICVDENNFDAIFSSDLLSDLIISRKYIISLTEKEEDYFNLGMAYYYGAAVNAYKENFYFQKVIETLNGFYLEDYGRDELRILADSYFSLVFFDELTESRKNLKKSLIFADRLYENFNKNSLNSDELFIAGNIFSEYANSNELEIPLETRNIYFLKGIESLEKSVLKNPTTRHYMGLAQAQRDFSFYDKTQDSFLKKAIFNYSKALKLDPNNDYLVDTIKILKNDLEYGSEDDRFYYGD